MASGGGRGVPIVQESFSLPTEIWTMILEGVERNNDLLACRQVNRQWHNITTPICQRRFLRPNLSGVLETPYNNLTPFCSTFKNMNILPWSACELEFRWHTHNRRSISFIKLKRFIRLFGSHILELKIARNDMEEVMFTLNGLPNLKYLDISRMHLQETIVEPFTFTNQLGKLNGLIATISNAHNFRFFELLLNRPEVHLRSLQLKIEELDDWLMEGDDCDVLSAPALMTGIPIFHLEVNRIVPPEFFIQLKRRGVQVNKFIIRLQTVRRFAVRDLYLSVEEFLKSTSESLKEFTLNDGRWEGQIGNSQLTIPTLPQLSYLEVNAERSVMGNPLLSNVTSGQFPKLAKVKVGLNSRIGRATFFDLGPFPTVTELGLSDLYPMGAGLFKTDWHRIFPNLKELDAHLVGKELPVILTKFQRLERLFLTVWRPTPKPSEDLSTIFSGGRKFGNEMQGQKCIPGQRESGAASLLSLTSLKEFKFKVYPEQHTISDAFVDSCLLKIQPLDNLCLNNVIISDEYMEKLRQHHRKAQIYKNQLPYKDDVPRSFDGLR